MNGWRGRWMNSGGADGAARGRHSGWHDALAIDASALRPNRLRRSGVRPRLRAADMGKPMIACPGPGATTPVRGQHRDIPSLLQPSRVTDRLPDLAGSPLPPPRSARYHSLSCHSRQPQKAVTTPLLPLAFYRQSFVHCVPRFDPVECLGGRRKPTDALQYTVPASPDEEYTGDQISPARAKPRAVSSGATCCPWHSWIMRGRYVSLASDVGRVQKPSQVVLYEGGTKHWHSLAALPLPFPWQLGTRRTPRCAWATEPVPPAPTLGCRSQRQATNQPRVALRRQTAPMEDRNAGVERHVAAGVEQKVNLGTCMRQPAVKPIEPRYAARLAVLSPSSPCLQLACSSFGLCAEDRRWRREHTTPWCGARFSAASVSGQRSHQRPGITLTPTERSGLVVRVFSPQLERQAAVCAHEPVGAVTAPKSGRKVPRFGRGGGGFAPDGAVTTAAFVMDPNPNPHGWRHPLVAWLGLAQQGRPKFVVFDVSSAISSSALRSPRSISRQL
ncbi:hypothetical protein Purlil1_3871 [Purpureocillium lilacinum]|uniref:Uncharacterized protein n=1 Tax=Purpureocillium lilacinum TaxID=33203 RepID=A0ABR0C6S6_PURLI|nr:hypothetical protein Purlil1_3871 [Purpureocillium lilacinum]